MHGTASRALSTTIDDPTHSRPRRLSGILSRWAGQTAALSFGKLFSHDLIRRRLAFEVRHRHFQELGISVPLGHGLQCPIYSTEYWCSFSEIFLSDEYNEFLKDMPLPTRWLDLGAHAGFFSLWVAWQRARQNLSIDCEAVLVDADSRVTGAVERLITVNRLENRFRFKHGAISEREGDLLFAERSCMSSASADLVNTAENTRRVPVLAANDLLRMLPPPYDLVKLDVEGSEYDFLKAYSPVIKATRHLLLEWHSWHRGGGGRKQIKQLATEMGFECVVDRPTAHVGLVDGRAVECGVLLLRRT